MNWWSRDILKKIIKPQKPIPMKKLFKYLVMLLFVIVACKKESAIIETPNPSWSDTQKVRVKKILVVNDSVSFGYDTIEYHYDTYGKLSEIITKNKYKSYVHPIRDEDAIEIDYSFVGCLGYYWKFHSNKFRVQNERVQKIEGKYDWDYLCTDAVFNSTTRNSNFNYGQDGLLKSIYNNIVRRYFENGRIESDIQNITYSGNKVEKFQVVSYEFVPDTIQLETERYTVEPTYIPAEGVPDGLRRMVNQALLGLNSIGFEEYVFYSNFAHNRDLSLVYFFDWWVSFGFPELQTLPSQDAGLVSSKRMQGKKGAYMDGGEYTFTQVDSTASYPYTHDAQNKTLEIAGLKIWYELVE